MSVKEVQKRARELEVTLKALPVVARISPPISPEKRPAASVTIGEAPVGQLREFPNSIKITSRKSLQEQWIPRGAKQFKDTITGELEEV